MGNCGEAKKASELTTAEAYAASKLTPISTPQAQPPQPPIDGASGSPSPKPGSVPFPVPPAGINRVNWQGDVPPQKRMNFYTKVLSKFATHSGLKIVLSVEIAPDRGVSNQRVAEMRVALRELGLSDELSVD